MMLYTYKKSEVYNMDKHRHIELTYMKICSARVIFDSMLQFEEPELRKQSHFWVMGLNDDGLVVCAYLVGLGYRHIRDYSTHDIFAIAIKANATKMIVAHNIVNSKIYDLTEDDEDGSAWLYQAAKILGIKLEHHIIL